MTQEQEINSQLNKQSLCKSGKHVWNKDGSLLNLISPFLNVPKYKMLFLKYQPYFLS